MHWAYRVLFIRKFMDAPSKRRIFCGKRNDFSRIIIPKLYVSHNYLCRIDLLKGARAKILVNERETIRQMVRLHPTLRFIPSTAKTDYVEFIFEECQGTKF